MTAREFRVSLGKVKLSQRQLAFRLRVAVGTVNRWATGKNPIPESVALLLACWKRDGVPKR